MCWRAPGADNAPSKNTLSCTAPDMCPVRNGHLWVSLSLGKGEASGGILKEVRSKRLWASTQKKETLTMYSKVLNLPGGYRLTSPLSHD